MQCTYDFFSCQKIDNPLKWVAFLQTYRRGFSFIAEKVSQFQKQKPFRANEDFYDCLAIKTADKTSDKHE